MSTTANDQPYLMTFLEEFTREGLAHTAAPSASTKSEILFQAAPRPHASCSHLAASTAK